MRDSCGSHDILGSFNDMVQVDGDLMIHFVSEEAFKQASNDLKEAIGIMNTVEQARQRKQQKENR